MRSGLKQKAGLALLALSFILPASTPDLSASAVPASGVSADAEGHWAGEALSRWLDQGLLVGDENGKLLPDRPVTRAEWMAMANGRFGYAATGESVSFTDVNRETWYAADAAAAVRQGYIAGYADGTLRPNQAVTRAEAAVMLGRLGQLGPAAQEPSFTDAVPAWSKGAVAAVVAAGWMNGYPDGTFRGSGALTRAEAIVALDRAFEALQNARETEWQKGSFDRSGIYGPSGKSADIAGDAVISADGVTLQNLVIQGNLTLSEAIGSGDVHLSGVTIQGELRVNGGGEHSVYLTNTHAKKLIVGRPDGRVRIIASGSTTIGETSLLSGAILEERELANGGNGFEEIDIASGTPKASLVQLRGQVHRVRIAASGVRFELLSGEIGQLEISRDAVGNTVYLAPGTTVRTAILYSPVTMEGQGTVLQKQLNYAVPANSNAPSNGGGGSSPPASPPANPPTVTSLTYSPDELEFAALRVASNITLTAAWSDGKTANVTAEAAWSSEDEKVAIVAGGVVTSQGEGETWIGAAYGGRTVRIPVKVTVVPEAIPAYRVTLNVENSHPAAGESVELDIRVEKSDGTLDTGFSGSKKLMVEGLESAPDGTVGRLGGSGLTGPSGEADVPFVGGKATVSLSLNKADMQSLTFAVEGLVQPEAHLTLIPAASSAVKLVVATEPSASVISGETLAVQPVIHVLDAYGNLTASTLSVTADLGSGSASVSGTTTVAAMNGVAVFTDLALSGSGSDVTLRFSADSLPPAISRTVSLNPFASGDGTSGAPYVITSAAQLDNMRNHLDGHFVLGGDIDLAGYNWTPIGDVFARPFTGELDGQGHSILHLTSRHEHGNGIGLFGFLDGGRISNLVLPEVSVIGEMNVGALAGSAVSAEISRVTVSGQVKVTGANVFNAGGLLGRLDAGEVRQSSAGQASFDIIVEGNRSVGGLVGSLGASAKISESYAKGFVSNNASALGGLVGSNYGTIEDSYAMVYVLGGSTEVGGLAGYSSGQVVHSYAAGPMDTSSLIRGGLIGQNVGTVTDAYYDSTATKQSDTGNGMPKTTAEMKQAGTFAGWSTGVWALSDGSYPILRWQEP